MLRRLAIVIYIFLSVPLLGIPFYTLIETRFWEDLNVKTYQARCLKNGKLVVLQGSLTNSPYTFNDKNIHNVELDVEDSLRFYCKYYDELEQYKSQYINAINMGDDNARIEANKAFWQFRENEPKVYETNYSLEALSTNNNYYPLWDSIIRAGLYTFIYFVLLQIVRIIYQYVVFGLFTWHPYKGVKNKIK